MLVLVVAFVFWLAIKGELSLYAGFVTQSGLDGSSTNAGGADATAQPRMNPLGLDFGNGPAPTNSPGLAYPGQLSKNQPPAPNPQGNGGWSIGNIIGGIFGSTPAY